MAKGQSALEYLTTYSWAIIVIIIVAVVLFELGILSPQQPNDCTLQVYFSCIQGYKLANNGMLNINIYQSTPDPINVIAIGCNTNVTFAGQKVISPPAAMLTNSNALFQNVPCYSGSAVAAGKIGQVFTGSLTINYIDEYTNANGVIFGRINVAYSGS